MEINWEHPYPYVPTNLIAVLLEGIVGATVIENATLRSLIDIHPREITGINNDLHFNGSLQQKPLRPCFTYTERKGKPIEKFAYTLGKLQHKDVRNGFTVLFIELTEDYQAIEEAWLCTNMTLVAYDSVPRVRDLGKSVQHKKLDGLRLNLPSLGKTPYKSVNSARIKFTPPTKALSTCKMHFECETVRGDAVMVMAKAIFEQLTIDSANPHNRKDFMGGIDGAGGVVAS